jgi:EF hand
VALAIPRFYIFGLTVAAYAINGIKEALPMIWRTTILAIAAAVFLIAGVPAWAEPNNASSIKTLDTDSDGTVDLAEAKKAASALFDRLERDKDGTLDKHELAGRLSAKELAVADPDHDGTLSKDEYLAIVEQRFNAADSDNDGTLDAKELHSSAGVSPSCG